MTYLQFHLVFILPPLLLLAWLQRGRLSAVHPRAAVFLVAIVLIALVYTTPWDNYLVWKGIWSYGPDRVVGTIGYVPLEEYLFFVLQPIATGLWLYRLTGAGEPAGQDPGAPAARGREGGPSLPGTVVPRVVGALVYSALAVAGLFLLRFTAGTYLGLILVWAPPVLALQWAYAGGEIWRRRRIWLAGFAFPTLYLWAADAVAIHLGIWQISPLHTLGPALGPLPLEEAVFFLLTNLLVVQGLLLFLFPPRKHPMPHPLASA